MIVYCCCCRSSPLSNNRLGGGGNGAYLQPSPEQVRKPLMEPDVDGDGVGMSVNDLVHRGENEGKCLGDFLPICPFGISVVS